MWLIGVIALTFALAQSADAGGLEVTWAAPTVPVRRYVIERRVEVGGAKFAPIVHVGPGEVRFVDDRVTPGVRYCYRVRGVRVDESSSVSGPLCATAEPSAIARASAEPRPTPP
jgi:hypothetical protein